MQELQRENSRRTAAESKLAEVTAERDLSGAECAELKLRMQQQTDSPASRMQQDHGHRGFLRQPQPPGHHDGLVALLLQKLTQVRFVSPPILPMAARVCMCASLFALSSTLAATGEGEGGGGELLQA